MWGSVKDRKAALEVAIAFTGNAELYGDYMIRVVSYWPNSCINALTGKGQNRKAWVGHAACALAHNIPEDITRLAWGKLTDEQRILANRRAAYAIGLWEANYRKSSGVCKYVGRQMLFEWDT